MGDETTGPGQGSAASGDSVLRRAGAVRGALEALWGDEMPPGDDPVTAVLADAVVADDEAGRDAGYVVTGDRLTTSGLAALLALPGDAWDRAALLPGELRHLVEALLDPPTALGAERTSDQLAD